MKLIAVGLSPNTFPSDVKLAARLLVQPWRWQGYLDSPVELVGVGERVWLFESGRSALLALLKAFGIGQGDEVVIQAFTCVAVPNPVMWVGAKPVYADIDKKTLNFDLKDLRQKITARSKGVIVQHTFGLPAPMSAIKQIAQERNLVVIEDCAHALGSEYQGEKVGTLGDAAFYSFGRDKVISSVAGGAAAINLNGKTQIVKLQAVHEGLKAPPRRWILRRLLHPITSEIVLATYGCGLGKPLHSLFQGLGVTTRANTEGEKRFAEQPSWVPSRMPNALRVLVQEQLGRLEQFNQRRRQIAQAYIQAGIKSAQPSQEGRIWLRFPIRSKNPARLQALAKKHEIVLGDWYDQVVAPKGVSLTAVGYQHGSCPVAEEVSRKIVNLPTYPKMTDEDIQRVIAIVQAFQNED